MRHVFCVFGASICLSAFCLSAFCLAAPTASASEIGLPTTAFVQSWVGFPTSRFTQGALGPFKESKVRAEAVADTRIGPLLDDAFASARDPAGRRGIGLNEMTTSWDQQTRTAFQHLRDAEVTYAGADAARHERFVATLARAIDGTGRSAADGGTASADLDAAYAKALARQAGDRRAAAEHEQSDWRAYRDAFAAFQDLQASDRTDGVTAELDRQRAKDLAAPAAP